MEIGSCWRLILVNLCFFSCQHVQAAPFMTCTSTSGAIIDFGLVSPLQDLRHTLSGSCFFLTDLRDGGYYNQTQGYNLGQGESFFITKTFTHFEVPKFGSGKSDVCIANKMQGASCANIITKGTLNPYEFQLAGVADGTPGVHAAKVQIIAVPFNLTSYSLHTVESLTVSYTVAHPACSLGSAPNLSLPFGTINSEDFTNSQRIAEIRLNCPSASLVGADLIPTQPAVSGSVGVSATTLDGLSMAATWADNGEAVVFNSPRVIELTKGDNLIRLGFRPKLNTRDSPAGQFSSQYTLNLTYR